LGGLTSILQGRIVRRKWLEELPKETASPPAWYVYFRLSNRRTHFVLCMAKGGRGWQRSSRACLYYYFIDAELGLMHVRVPTWFPFAIQMYVNGHEWLARQLDKRHLGYKRADNAFVELDDSAATQRLSNRFPRLKWTRILDRLAKQTNPHLGKLLGSLSYYWCIDQAEYSTDIMFSDTARFGALYEQLLRHATITFGADDVMHFLGRKMSGNFQGEVHSRFVRRWPGARIKHSMKRNWIKMYNKEGRVLRIETVINQPREFKIRRKGIRHGCEVTGWFPMAKRVANMERYAEVSLTANTRYMQALKPIDAYSD
jgi:hypothetical protein